MQDCLRRVWLGVGGVFMLAVTVGVAMGQPAQVGEWRAFGASPENTKYSALDQIDNYFR